MSDGPDAALTFDRELPVLVTGASGTIGSRVVAGLVAAGRPVRAALVDPDRSSADLGAAVTPVRFDFTDAATWPATFAGVETLFLVRPPRLSNVDRDMVPALEAAKAAGVRHMVLLSLQGADSNRFVPHAALEAWLKDSGLGWTLVRPSFFAENLRGTHVSDIRDRDEIVVPAGSGATAFVTANDVAAVAVATLLNPAAHRGLAWTPTGPAALTYFEVAATLSDVLGRPVRYRNPGVLRYARHARSALGMPWAMVGVTMAIYTVARLGRADGLTDDVRIVTGRDPVSFRDWAEQHRAVWARGS